MAVTVTVPSDSELRCAVQTLVDYCSCRELIGHDDRAWAYNTVLECAGATGPAPQTAWVLAQESEVDSPADFNLEGTLDTIAEAAVNNGVAEDTASGRDRASMRIMGTLMPKPSECISEFHGRLGVGEPVSATDWFYKMSCDAGYVRRAAIARNICWDTQTRWGNLEITINLSKPEKDPRDIAAAGAAKPSSEVYPACQLCIENEGYPGRGASTGSAHPARQNLRIIPIELGGDRWGLQYSPYAYFNEHCIAMSCHHRPMHIDAEALECLLDFVDTLPHYFIGSNADLPIVGGSILSHDHYQGGAHEFAMMKAKVAGEFTIPGFEGVEGAVMQWPLSVLRLRGTDRTQVAAAAVHVIDAWRAWTDAEAGVVARSEDGTPHNTVTPIVRRVDSLDRPGGDIYEVFLALRCNITTDEHPMGVFHPHAEWHHIKKENIGLIEVMGLAVLPPRLVGELGAVEDLLVDAASGTIDAAGLAAALEANELAAPHAAWAEDVFARRGAQISKETAQDIVREEVGQVFGHVLEDAGVFKWDEAGRAAQQRFIDSL